jgi:hypothetical protein
LNVQRASPCSAESERNPERASTGGASGVDVVVTLGFATDVESFMRRESYKALIVLSRDAGLI